MKLIKSIKLAFKEGNADKVYEVDLCDLLYDAEQRFLVNFRYGRRGRALRQGTKTPVPTDYQTAQEVFNSVVVAKINKGYIDHDNPRPDPTKVNIERSLDPTAFLARIKCEPHSAQRARMIWRLPQQLNGDLADGLIAGLTKGEWPEIYSRLWVIGRVGNPSHGQAVAQYLNVSDAKVASLALEVLIKLAFSPAMKMRDDILYLLPEHLMKAIGHRNADEITKSISVCLYDANGDHNALLKNLYLLASAFSEVHQALFNVITTLPIRAGYFKGLRYIFKMAEFRLDSAFFALLTQRFETSPPGFYSDFYLYYTPKGKTSKLKEEMDKPNCSIAFSNKTRDYFRRRSWRCLRRLATRNDDRYVAMASAILLAFSPQDKRAERRWEIYDYEEQKLSVCRYDGYASYLALNHILYQNSHSVRPNAMKNAWKTVGEEAELRRTEAYPYIWDRHPDALYNLLLKAKINSVNEFAAKALKDNEDYCQDLSDDQILLLLASKVSCAIEFSLALLTQRTISPTLILALLQSGNASACELALNALQKMPDAFALPHCLVQLLLIDNQGLRDWMAGRWLAHTFLPSDYPILAQVAEALPMSEVPFNEAHAKWLSSLFIQHMPSAVHNFSIEAIKALLKHNKAAVQLFAAHLLVANRIAFSDIAEETLASLTHSQSSAIRATGVLLLSKLSDYDLLERLPLLVEIIYQREWAERQACFDTLVKLLPTYASQVFAQLLPLVFKREVQDGQQQALSDFIEHHLSKERDRLDRDTVWRLLHASAVAAQNMGIAALYAQAPSLFTVKQWAVLANNANLATRQYAHRAYENNVAAIKANTRDALRILDSVWLESREFGFDFFTRHYQASDWSVELIVAICDSNLADTQTFGRTTLQTFFQKEQGEAYLLKLSQHPSIQVQAIVSHLLNQYAAGRPEIIVSLKGYFTSVLSQINKGRVSKNCVLAFLIQEASGDPLVLEMVSELFIRLSLTLVQKDKAELIKAMLTLKKRHPELIFPLTVRPVRSQTAQGERHAG